MGVAEVELHGRTAYIGIDSRRRYNTILWPETVCGSRESRGPAVWQVASCRTCREEVMSRAILIPIG